MEREQFTFYQSFEKAIARIKKKADRCDAYDAIVKYALYGEVPDLDKIAESAAIAFELSKPVLDASRRKAESGKAGGNAKQTASKPQANEKQTESKTEQTASKKENKKEGEIEKEKENECSLLERKLKERAEPSSEPSSSDPVLAEEKIRLTKAEYAELMTMPTAEFSERMKGFPERARLQLIGDRYRRGAFDG